MGSVSRRKIGWPSALIMGLLLGSDLAGAAASAVPLVQQARLRPADVVPGDSFGGVMSADGHTVLLTALQQACAAGVACGAVYVYAFVQGAWAQQAKLSLPDAAANDRFGEAVALSADGGVALVGSSSRACGLGKECGAVYVFERSGGVWSGGERLDSPSPEAFGRFGQSVGLSGAGDVAVVGAVAESCCGVVHVFRRASGTWSLETTLHPDVIGEFFGNSIGFSRDGTTLLVTGDLVDPVSPGAIYVFHKTGGTWSRETKIVPPAPDVFIFYTAALSGDGQTAVIAVVPLTGPLPNGTQEPLVYYVFARNAGVWTQQGPVLPTGEGSGSAGLSFDGNTAILGLRQGGKAPLFVRNGNTWSFLSDLTPSGPGAGGASAMVALSDDARTAVVGLLDGSCFGFFCQGTDFIFAADAFSADVPALSSVGLALLAVLIAGTGALRLRRRRATP